MRLRDYIVRVPRRDGRIPLLPHRPTPATTRWVVPDGGGWYLYCEADRADVFTIPDTIHASCLPQHLAAYDPCTWMGTVISPEKRRLFDAAERASLRRLEAWLADGQFRLAWDEDAYDPMPG